MASLRKADCIRWYRARRKLQLHFRAPRGLVVINTFSTCQGRKRRTAPTATFARRKRGGASVEKRTGKEGGYRENTSTAAELAWERRNFKQHPPRRAATAAAAAAAPLPWGCRGMARRPGPGAGRPPPPEGRGSGAGPAGSAAAPRPPPPAPWQVARGGPGSAGSARQHHGGRGEGEGGRPPRPAAHLPCPPLPCWGGGRGAPRSPSSWWAAGAGRRPASSRLPSLLAWRGAARRGSLPSGRCGSEGEAAAPPAEVTARRGGMILPGGREGGIEGGRGQSRGEAPPPPGGGHRGAAESPAALRALGRPPRCEGQRGCGPAALPCPARGCRGCRLRCLVAQRRARASTRRSRPVWDHLLRALAGAAAPRHARLGTDPAAQLNPWRGHSQEPGLCAWVAFKFHFPSAV